MNLDRKGLYESEDKMVSHPSHYQSKSGLEVIDVIKAFTDGLNGIEATDTGNIIKYACRWKDKNGIQDLEKILWYTQHLINHLKSNRYGEMRENEECEEAENATKRPIENSLVIDEDVLDKLVSSMTYHELCRFYDGILSTDRDVVNRKVRFCVSYDREYIDFVTKKLEKIFKGEM